MRFAVYLCMKEDDLMIIDVHAHIFPQKIAAKASHNIGLFYEGFTMQCDGSVERLLSEGDKAGVDRFLVHSVATSPSQVNSVNNFIASEVHAHPDRFIGFGSLHPDMENPEEGVQSIIDNGLVGVKLHPDMQRFGVDEPRAIRLIKTFEGRLPLLVHAGDYRYHWSNPPQIKKMMEEAPDLIVIAAHFGGYSVWNEAEELASYKNLYVDCSSSMYAMSDEEIVRRIRLFGADHVMFGSDYPMWTPKMELDRLTSLPLHADELEQVLYKTAQSLLKM